MIIMTKYKGIKPLTDVIVYDYISVLLSTLLFVDISECKYSEKSMEQASPQRLITPEHVCLKTSSTDKLSQHLLS